MLSDHVISIFGHSITITSHDFFLSGVFVLCGVSLLAVLFFSRKRVVVLKRSASTDQIAFELSRIADAVERIANRPAERAIAAASRRQHQEQMPPLLQRESQGVAFSTLGR